MSQDGKQFERRVVIIGVGLIGGSIAAAVRKRFPETNVVGIGRSEIRLKSAESAGLLTSFATELSAELFKEPSVVVVCLPVNMIADAVCQVAGLCGPDTLITDAGSVKAVICNAVADAPNANLQFIGSHPIAGGEHGGFEFADADLFVDKVCVVTNDGERPQSDSLNQRLKRFWEEIGCRVVLMSPVEHDRVLALTSHLPHVMAAVTTTAVGAENLPLTGSGFRDATRIAAGDAGLWTAILGGNREQVVSSIKVAEDLLTAYRTALEEDDTDQLKELLEAAAVCRSELEATDSSNAG